MACETHGIHSTLHNGDGLQPRQWVDRKREKKGIGSEFFKYILLFFENMNEDFCNVHDFFN